MVSTKDVTGWVVMILVGVQHHLCVANQDSAYKLPAYREVDNVFGSDVPSNEAREQINSLDSRITKDFETRQMNQQSEASDGTVVKHMLPRSSRACPCASVSLCDRVQTGPRKEVFVFSRVGTQWKHYDWSKVTTVVEYLYTDDELMCYAHSRGVRVIAPAHFHNTSLLTNSTARTEWVKSLVRNVTDNFLDGINVDFEDGIPATRPDLARALTSLIQELVDTMKAVYPYSQITFDFPSSPYGGRSYDYKAITDSLDFVFIMAYDEGSPGKYAWANSAFNITLHGIEQFLQMGLKPDKMILGVPWYGYSYHCAQFDEKTQHCTRNYSAGALSHTYAEVVQTLLPASFSGRQWDDAAKSPFIDIKDPETGQISQLWYDDAESLAIKYALARQIDMRGVGMWYAEAINYTDPGQVDRMWGALP